MHPISFVLPLVLSYNLPLYLASRFMAKHHMRIYFRSLLLSYRNRTTNSNLHTSINHTNMAGVQTLLFLMSNIPKVSCFVFWKFGSLSLYRPFR